MCAMQNETSPPHLLDVLAATTFGLLLFVLFWVVPVYFGIRNLRRKGYSPHWMWFGIHPVFGYIALLVSALISARKQCGKCGAYVAENFKLCPYCGHTAFHKVGRPDQPVPTLAPPV